MLPCTTPTRIGVPAARQRAGARTRTLPQTPIAEHDERDGSDRGRQPLAAIVRARRTRRAALTDATSADRP